MIDRAPVDVFRLPRRRIVILIGLGLAQSITLVVLVLILRYIVELLGSPYGRVEYTLAFIAFLAVILVANAVLRGVEFAYAERLGFEQVRQLRMRMYEHLGRMTPTQLQHRSRGALLLRFTGDVTMLRTWISRGVARGIVSSVVLVAVIATLAFLNVWIAVAAAGTLALGSAVSLATGETLRRKTRWVRRKRSLITSTIDEQIGALATVQTLGRFQGEYARMGRQNELLTRALRREADVRGALRGLSSGTAWLAMVAVMAVGAIEISRGRASIATVVAAATASRFAIGMVRDLGLAHDYWQRARVSRVKIEDFLKSSAVPPDGPADAPLRVGRGAIEFQAVSVPGTLNGLTASVDAGQVVAIMGPTGSGKSSLLKVVTRTLIPSSGRVLVDGQDLARSTASSLSRQISIVSPDLPLMRGTIRRNLTYRKPSAGRQPATECLECGFTVTNGSSFCRRCGSEMPKTSQAEVARIATLWRLDEAMAGRASGIHTWVTEAGGNLAAGQRQRIAIARAMVGSPRILLLDDPSRSLDPIGREILLRAIRNYRGTVLLVTNEPAEAALADEVWHMDGGTIASTESGDEYRSRLERTAPLLAERRPTPVVSLRNPAGPESPGAGQLS